MYSSNKEIFPEAPAISLLKLSSTATFTSPSTSVSSGTCDAKASSKVTRFSSCITKPCDLSSALEVLCNEFITLGPSKERSLVDFELVSILLDSLLAMESSKRE
uniref:Uncharacterized protein n=1 Tax=Arundo donax TaxID=35708 RepID=A0A0A9HHF0_ARUDO